MTFKAHPVQPVIPALSPLCLSPCHSRFSRSQIGLRALLCLEVSGTLLQSSLSELALILMNQAQI